MSTEFMLPLALGFLTNEYVFISLALHEAPFLGKRLKMMINGVLAVIY